MKFPVGFGRQSSIPSFLHSLIRHSPFDALPSPATRMVTASPALLQPPTAAPLPHSGTSVRQYFAMHYVAALFPLTAGGLLYGWRGAWAVVVVVCSAAAAVFVWRRVGAAGRQLRYAQALWLATLLGFMLPAHLVAGGRAPDSPAPWPVLVVAGFLVVMLLWLLGGLGAGRVHPVVAAFLVLFILFEPLMTPDRVLQRRRALLGNLSSVAAEDTTVPSTQPWVQRPPVAGGDALRPVPGAKRLLDYTRGTAVPDRGLLRMQGMLRDQMPPLEDFIVGGQPAPVGAGCAIAVIIGGLFLLYRGLIDFRVPLLSVLTAFVALLILPVPARIADHAQWRWLALREPDVGLATAVTFANYELVASPLLFTAFFLATAPSSRPMSRRARMLYAVVLGALAAVFQLYVSVSVGPYLALLFTSLVAPELDRVFRPRKLV